MREPNISSITILSFVMHLVFITVALIVIKQSNRIPLPTPYIVNLVGPIIEKTTEAKTVEDTSTATAESNAKMVTDSSAAVKKKTDDKDKTNEYIEDRIAALKAKKKVQTIVKLRNIIALSHSGSSEKESAEPAQKSAGSGNVISGIGYEDKIKEELMQYWAFPKIGDENLMAVISITVFADGKVRINKIEKSSGNPLFDRSVLNSINKASPLSKPPYEMEVEVTFGPW